MTYPPEVLEQFERFLKENLPVDYWPNSGTFATEQAVRWMREAKEILVKLAELHILPVLKAQELTGVHPASRWRPA